MMSDISQKKVNFDLVLLLEKRTDKYVLFFLRLPQSELFPSQSCFRLTLTQNYFRVRVGRKQL
jgi:hypothetical protein